MCQPVNPEHRDRREKNDRRSKTERRQNQSRRTRADRRSSAAESEPEQKRIIRERLSASSGWYYEAGTTLAASQTAYQSLELVQTPEFGTTLLLDGATQVMEKNDFQYHEPMAHLALLAHPNPERVLIIGGGDGGLAREVLKHPSLKQLDFIELDQGVVQFSQAHLPDLGGAAFADPRVKLTFADGRAFVEAATPQTYDVILMDMTDPFGPALMLYTQEYFAAVKRLLKNQQSFFVMHSESPETRPQAFTRIRRTLASVFPVVRGAYAFVRMYATLWSFALVSTGTDPAAIPAAVLAERLVQRQINDLQLLSADTIPALYTVYPYIARLLEAPGDISTDAAPDFPDTFDPKN